MLRFFGFSLFFFLVSCSTGDERDNDARDSNGKNATELADEAASMNKKTIVDMVELLEGGLATIDNVDSLYDASKYALVKYGKMAADMSKKDYEAYAHNYQILAYEGNDSLMLIVSQYRDSIIQADPGDVMALQLQSYLSLGVYADPEMTRRVFPSEYEELYAK